MTTFTGNGQTFISHIYDYTEDYLAENLTRVTAADLGLSERCGNAFFVDETTIVVKYRNDRLFRTYAGLEDIQTSDRKVICGWVFYPRVESRIDTMLTYYEGRQRLVETGALPPTQTEFDVED
ncbi:MAG: hypothetical protein P4L79_10180 [Legionella sp.]|uniref:hypothetical protein n=1 Tax=Legionella sp. TaxID=459 RepID=UPI00283B6EE7|nr:hypothetical protein [Legionella sp.]